LVFGIDDVPTKMQGVYFKGRMLSRYMSWNNGKLSYIFQIDLVNHEGCFGKVWSFHWLNNWTKIDLCL
jgi:hypothetical protein